METATASKPKTEFRIETRFGFYSKAVKLAWARFPERVDCSFQGADVYADRVDANRALKAAACRLKIIGGGNVIETPV